MDCAIAAEHTTIAPSIRRTRMLPSVVGGPRLVGTSEASASAPRCRSAVQFGCVVPSGVGGADGDEASGDAEVAVVAGFAFVRAAGGFTAASSAMTGSGVMTVVEALPASPVCIELESFTAIRTGTLCG